MKLVTFNCRTREDRIGAMAPDGSIVDLNAAYALCLRNAQQEGAFYALADARVPASMRGLFDNGDRGLDAARSALEYALKEGPEITGASGEPIRFQRNAIRIKAPIVPKKFFHTAGNFREHHEEAQKSGFPHPVLPWIMFFQNVDAIIGPDEPIVYPEHLTQELDYELELAVVMKKSGKHFNAERAVDYIGGYVIFNDVTARDIQRQEMKSGVFSFCKGIDTFCPLGPHIVTADEIPNPNNLAMELRVNGKLRQQSHSSKMSVTVPEIIAHYSSMDYSAGDVLSTGTVSGVAAFSEDPKSLYLRPGDLVECEIEKIGVLRNPVVSYKETHGGNAAAKA
jgi:2-keto-4-pentenoate hydratase/2-oxohepta-3-ene-1,7-dioic acid hydratase in catechol pathway